MTVEKLMKILKEEYKPTDNLIIAYWDKPFAELQTETKLTNDQWDAVVEIIEDREWCDVNDEINEAVEDVKEDGDRDGDGEEEAE